METSLINLVQDCGHKPAIDEVMISKNRIECHEANSHLLAGNHFFYDAVQKAIGVNARILTATPPGSTIIDVGAGIKSRFSIAELETGGHQLVNVDQVYNEGYFMPEGPHPAVAVDLNSLPAFMGRTDLKTALRILCRSVPDALRTEMRLLIKIIQSQIIGSFVFSHSIAYMPIQTSRKILQICANSLIADGKILIFEASKALAGSEMQYAGLVYELLQERPDLELEADLFFVPALTPQLDQELNELGAVNLDAAVQKLEDKIISGEITIETASGPESDDGTHELSLDGGNLGYGGRAERMIILKKIAHDSRD